jgi:DDE family transposase
MFPNSQLPLARSTASDVFLHWLSRPGRWLSYSVGMTITDAIHQAVLKIPKRAWTPAYDADGVQRPGAWIAEITDVPDLSSWPKGMRLIVRKERPHPGAQLRIADVNGNRITCFATNTKGGQLADLELRHCCRARAEDRIRAARDTGLRNLPLHGFTQNQVWLEIVSLALDLLALDADARPDRCHPSLGAQTAPTQVVLRRRPTGQHRPTPMAPPTAALAPGRRDHHSDGPTPRPSEPRLTSHTPFLRAVHPPESGTRRPPDATAGLLTCPPAS